MIFLNKSIVEAFAKTRHSGLSFPYLKENGELLSIAVTSNALVEPVALSYYSQLYADAKKVFETYPQYYRFILRLVLDLEDLGMTGEVSHFICDHVIEMDLIGFETSDTRRLETLTLLSRRRTDNLKLSEYRRQLNENVELFISNSERFERLNKPLFYEFTHIIFFLTQYGNVAWPLSNDPEDCLLNVGTLALLDDDFDLLCEVCICLHFLGKRMPQYWLEYACSESENIVIGYNQDVRSSLNSSTDEYHPYLVANWLKALINKPCFIENFSGRRPNFTIPHKSSSLLSEISMAMHKDKFSGSVSRNAFNETIASFNPEQNELLTAVRQSSQSATNLINIYSDGGL